MTELHHDVIIVGGRPAGASLAARLGKRGVRVAVVDRAEMPSPPAVPSCPILYPPGMRLLDELGIEEAAYTDDTARVDAFSVDFGGHFEVTMPVPMMFGRDHVAGIDRATFDHVLWASLARYPTVTARAGFAVTELLRDPEGRVIGVTGRAGGGAIETLRARCVVGADGRYSLVARKAGAKVVEDCSERVSTVYFAPWEGVALSGAGGGGQARVYTTGRGSSVLFFPATRGRTNVATHQRADRVDVHGDAEAYYLGVLRSYEGVRRRIEPARRVGPVLGIKRVGNRYVTHGGPGWVLVGDALHHKDPVDGQGIYDALVMAKLLDEALAAFLDGARTWDEALADYHRAVMAETHPMFLATMKRLEMELYDEPPAIVIRTLIRWLLCDPEYQRRFLLFLGRAIPPGDWLPPSLMRAAAVRGLINDLKGLVRARRVR